MKYAVPADHSAKLKESEKGNVSEKLARKLNKLWNMKVALAPIVIGSFDAAAKGLVQCLENYEISRREVIIQTTSLLDWPEYWEELWRLEGICCHSNPSEKLSAKAGLKTLWVLK